MHALLISLCSDISICDNKLTSFNSPCLGALCTEEQPAGRISRLVFQKFDWVGLSSFYAS